MGHTPTHRLSGSGTDEGGGGAGGGGSQSAWDIAPPWGVVDTNDYIKGLQDGFSSGILQQIRDNFTTPISDADLQSEVDLWNEAGMDFSDVPLTATDSQVMGRQDISSEEFDINLVTELDDLREFMITSNATPNQIGSAVVKMKTQAHRSRVRGEFDRAEDKEGYLNDFIDDLDKRTKSGSPVVLSCIVN